MTRDGQYLVHCAGDCLVPLFADGDVAVVDPSAEIEVGDLVEFTMNGGALGFIKVLCDPLPPRHLWNDPAHCRVKVRQFNPPGSAVVRLDRIESVAAVVGRDSGCANAVKAAVLDDSRAPRIARGDVVWLRPLDGAAWRADDDLADLHIDGAWIRHRVVGHARGRHGFSEADHQASLEKHSRPLRWVDTPSVKNLRRVYA